MTNYGTIPTSTGSGGTNLEFISRGKERLRTGLGSRRPWKEMLNYHSIGLPSSLGDAIGRIKTNLAYFRMNYAIIVLICLFLWLLWHPISLIVLAIMAAAWIFLYFLRDEPLVLFHKTVDDRIVLAVLSVLTIVFLFLTNATLNILFALLTGAVLLLIHAVFRRTDDLFEDVESGGDSASLLVPGGSSPSS